MMIPAQTKVLIKQGATFAITIIFAVIYGIVADAVNLNSYLFPWVASWTLRTKIETSACGLFFLLVLVLVAWARVNISRQDVTYER